MNILCVIPARGNSKGLKNKNIKLLLGKPIIAYSIEAALESKLIDKVVVSSEDEKIKRVAKKLKIQVIKRPKKFATDSSPIEPTLRHAVRHLQKKEKYDVDIVVWLQANVPNRKKGQIDRVIKKLISSGADSAATVYPISQYPQWMKVLNRNGFLSPFMLDAKEFRRQDIKPMYLLDGAVVAVKKEVLMDTEGKKGPHVFMGRKIAGILQEKEYTIEVDEKDDIALAEYYLKKRAR